MPAPASPVKPASINERSALGQGKGPLAAGRRRQGELGKEAKLCAWQRILIVQKCHRLHSCHFKPFAAADVLAGHHIIAPDHVALGLGELGAVALVGTPGKLFLFGTHQPGKFVIAGLTAVRTRQRMRLFSFFLVKKIALVHLLLLLTKEYIETQESLGVRVNSLECLSRGDLPDPPRSIKGLPHNARFPKKAKKS